jgi:hypothetical protein
LDYDGDGWDDLLACRLKAQTPILYRNNGGTTFSAVSPTVSGLTAAVADQVVVDLNTDGRPDLLSAGRTTFAYQLNRGSNTTPRFGAPVRIRSISSGEGRSVAAADADGDGDIDVYTMVGSGGGSTNPSDALLINNGSLGFTSIATPAANGEADEVVALMPHTMGPAQFLSLNGGGKTGGPIQLMTAR